MSNKMATVIVVAALLLSVVGGFLLNRLAENDSRDSLYYKIDDMRVDMVHENLGILTGMAGKYHDGAEPKDWVYPGKPTVHDEVNYMLAYRERMDFVRERAGEDNKAFRFGQLVINSNSEFERLLKDIDEKKVVRKDALDRAYSILAPLAFSHPRKK